jgi:hypothetical protein
MNVRHVNNINFFVEAIVEIRGSSEVRLREAEMMRIAVLGGGALGGYFAAHLARADSEKLG